MALLDLWTKDRTQLEGKSVQQVITFAGDGRLKDANATSTEFRAFLAHTPPELLERYGTDCLTTKFDDSGYALQDVVNEIGRRLGFKVEDGRYRGVQGQIGHDGIWRSADDHSIVIEVKTTDAYRIDLDTSAGYRRELVTAKRIIEDRSSILIVVGRQDTGDLEAQVRGSRHAWDIRLISVDALVRLMHVRAAVDDPSIVRQIATLLVPKEFTRLDAIVDLVFSTAEDVQAETEAEDEPQATEGNFSAPSVAAQARDACIKAVQGHLGSSLVKRGKVLYTTPAGDLAVVCAVSKPHKGNRFWFAFHDHHEQMLATLPKAYIALSCAGEQVLLIPFQTFRGWLPSIQETHRNGRSFWHISLRREATRFFLSRKSGHERVDLTGFVLAAKK
jgi:hypothetical protein